jgi:hypothetical protein
VSEATGLARNTISTGIREIQFRRRYPRAKITERIRKSGGGRKKITTKDPRIAQTLKQLIRSTTRGHPMTNLQWICKSTRNLASELIRLNHRISHRTVSTLLKNEGFSLQANRKTKEGSQHPDRNDQFQYIDNKVSVFIENDQPAISIDTKKKELVGEFKNIGREWSPSRDPVKVKSHDFPEKDVGKAVPYGIYDLARNEGWVSVGITNDTAEFATESIYRWWDKMGKKRYPHAQSLMITADSGGSNGIRNKLWKVTLQKLSDAIGLKLHVSHFPPGTSKWNKIEHRLFCFVTNNWRGRPLTSYQVIVNLIASTRNSKGLKVMAALDTNLYETGIQVTKEQLESVNIRRDKFHGDWNYTISPNR